MSQQTIGVGTVAGDGTGDTLRAAMQKVIANFTENYASITSINSTISGYGSPFSASVGGTGVNNGSSTITIGGNLAFSGAYAFTGTLTGATAVTFPTTGTLVNSAVTTLSSLVSVGTINTGTWNGTAISPTYGGTGVNNGSATLTMGGSVTHSGSFTTTMTVTGNTSVTLPTSGTLVNSAVTTLSALVSVGTIGTGVWQGTVVGPTYGGTGVNNGSSTITIGGSVTFSGAYTFTGTVTANTSVTFPTSGLLLTSKTLYDNGNGSTAVTIAFDNGNAQKLTLNAASCAITLTAPASGKPATIRLHVYNTSTFTNTWVTSILCSGGVKPVATTGTAHDVWVIDYDGTNFYASNVLPNVS